MDLGELSAVGELLALAEWRVAFVKLFGEQLPWLSHAIDETLQLMSFTRKNPEADAALQASYPRSLSAWPGDVGERLIDRGPT